MVEETKKQVFIIHNEICRRRSLDESRLAKYFELNNCRIVDNPETADYIIFVSCGLTNLREETAIT